MDTTKITLPNLRSLKFYELPELKTICSSSKVIVCDSLESIDIFHCPKLKRLPLSLPLLSNGQLSPPPSLQNIMIYSREWETIKIYNCPKLKRLPLSLPRLSNGQLSPPPSLKEIGAYDKGWWESLEWDCADTKDALQPFVNNSPHPYYMPYNYVRRYLHSLILRFIYYAN